MSAKLSLIVPAFNEAAHIASVINAQARALSDAHIEYEICVVDNGSIDHTRSIVDALHEQNPCIHVIRLEQNRGYGGGILAGLEQATGDVLCWVHADGQADPDDIVRLYRVMEEKGCDIVQAERKIRHESAWRKFQSRAYFFLFQLFFRTPYRDINGTPKMLKRRIAAALQLQSLDWFLEPEVVIKSRRHGIPIVEVETVWHSRESGSTRAHIFTGLEFLKNMIVYRVGLK